MKKGTHKGCLSIGKPRIRHSEERCRFNPDFSVLNMGLRGHNVKHI